MRLAAEREGLHLCPEAAVCLGVLERAVAERWIGPDESVVLFNTGAAQKYVEVLSAGASLPRLEKGAVDWSRLA